MRLVSVISGVAIPLTCLLTIVTAAQEPVIVQPGAPGKPTKVLPSSTRAQLPPVSAKDLEFMQGMIVHHAQAVEMTDLIAERTKNKDIHLIGARISKSQVDEMKFMKSWLEIRGAPVSHSTHVEMKSSDPHTHAKEPPHNPQHHVLMPGMLTPTQMDALKKARGAEFDRLFLTGMIQHHEGALAMVKALFDSAGAGQDAELFSFATDVDSGQRAEIRSMKTLLGEKP